MRSHLTRSSETYVRDFSGIVLEVPKETNPK
jgi:hypothetical protein